MLIKRVRQWGKDFGNKYRWFSFVVSIAFVGLSLFKIGTNDAWSYLLVIPQIILGILVIITYPNKVK